MVQVRRTIAIQNPILNSVFTVPMNHFAGKLISRAQENLMKTRDERVSLMNEILGAVRMLKVLSLIFEHGSSLTLSAFSISSWHGNAASKSGC
jgi:hypothetical protein